MFRVFIIVLMSFSLSPLMVKAEEISTLSDVVGEKMTVLQTVRKVEASKVCMVNDKYLGTEQIAVEVDGKKYYGCCKMCKAKLEKIVTLRMSTDPVSGVDVDKATAVIGAVEDGTVFYFESEENMTAFVPQEEEGLEDVVLEEE